MSFQACKSFSSTLLREVAIAGIVYETGVVDLRDLLIDLWSQRKNNLSFQTVLFSKLFKNGIKHNKNTVKQHCMTCYILEADKCVNLHTL